MRQIFFLTLLLCTFVKPALTYGETQSNKKTLPAGWTSGYASEPVFNSRVFWVEAGKGNDKTLLLVHGLGEKGWRDWEKLIPQLAKTHRVLAIDLPGFGRSENPGGKYSPTRYAQMIKALADKSGIKRFDLMGHSMGGAVALRFASHYPDSVDHLVLISVAGVLERSTFAQYSSALPLEAGMVSYFNALPEGVQDGISDLVRSVGGGLLRWDALPDPTKVISGSEMTWSAALGEHPNLNAALALVEEDYSGDLQQLEVPTLILWGKEDPVAPLRTGELLDGQIPNSTFLVYAGMGHMPVNYPEQIGQPIATFLQQTTWQAPSIEPQKNKGDFSCKDQSDLTLGGDYRHITITHCNNIVLRNVQAQSIHITDSNVTMTHVSAQADEVALSVNASNVTITNGHFSGKTGLAASDSHLDFAGVELIGRQEAMTNQKASRYVFSVSHLSSADHRQSLHGVYTFGSD
ncbi:alpha/beta fold hydrolase [Gilvimarinus algae]|uniref:Alpha/beta hydrolase n=1 Tax=Gilvimarinus algae TaxID=3058037 RepID=A0ABT8T9J1_9GAMM|nr:alpha/beta hydrolase [Gilvimarinus sp. SDUM040014]MDO3380762.1 alpha/beta hydrolase [Gilvimarinus sp. SDUM040014]